MKNLFLLAVIITVWGHSVGGILFRDIVFEKGVYYKKIKSLSSKTYIYDKQKRKIGEVYHYGKDWEIVARQGIELEGK